MLGTYTYIGLIFAVSRFFSDMVILAAAQENGIVSSLHLSDVNI